nr:type I restriction-modification system subunit M N-terminal domain-containing protein [Thermosynechococcus sp. M55_K2018_012]
MTDLLDIQQMENWLWDATCAIRGPVDAPKFKDDILPLVFLKRLSDVYDNEIARLWGDKRWQHAPVTNRSTPEVGVR